MKFGIIILSTVIALFIAISQFGNKNLEKISKIESTKTEHDNPIKMIPKELAKEIKTDLKEPKNMKSINNIKVVNNESPKSYDKPLSFNTDKSKYYKQYKAEQIKQQRLQRIYQSKNIHQKNMRLMSKRYIETQNKEALYKQPQMRQYYAQLEYKQYKDNMIKQSLLRNQKINKNYKGE